ncbi:hypothetical protein M433DRAFT_307933 [Acidomyces richmondensis BFW]|nr:MAG: hypothetical protein FE78DRAFT_457348 [Acidomyces sp. 'richmondensis']KYG44353.1 hypothetical protein M433DRAFT_307933 [Acidomyces richmondensis BFW]
MNTSPGGSDQQYEGNLGLVNPHKKSRGQLGKSSTATEPTQTIDSVQENENRSEKLADYLKNGEDISEQGRIGGMMRNTKGAVDTINISGGLQHERDSEIRKDDIDADRTIGN